MERQVKNVLHGSNATQRHCKQFELLSMQIAKWQQIPNNSISHVILNSNHFFFNLTLKTALLWQTFQNSLKRMSNFYNVATIFSWHNTMVLKHSSCIKDCILLVFGNCTCNLCCPFKPWQQLSHQLRLLPCCLQCQLLKSWAFKRSCSEAETVTRKHVIVFVVPVTIIVCSLPHQFVLPKNIMFWSQQTSGNKSNFLNVDLLKCITSINVTSYAAWEHRSFHGLCFILNCSCISVICQWERTCVRVRKVSASTKSRSPSRAPSNRRYFSFK